MRHRSNVTIPSPRQSPSPRLHRKGLVGPEAGLRGFRLQGGVHHREIQGQRAGILGSRMPELGPLVRCRCARAFDGRRTCWFFFVVCSCCFFRIWQVEHRSTESKDQAVKVHVINQRSCSLSLGMNSLDGTPFQIPKRHKLFVFFAKIYARGGGLENLQRFRR